MVGKLGTRGPALVMLLTLIGVTTASADAGGRQVRWILNGPVMTTFTTDPVAQRSFAGTRPFVVAPPWRHVVIPPAWGAIRTRIFTSYREFERAVANGRIDPRSRPCFTTTKAGI